MMQESTPKEEPSEVVESLTLRIQTSNHEGPKMVSVSIVSNDSVASLKHAVAERFTSTSSSCSPYIRLIAAGRLLAPDTASLEDFSLQSQQVIHAVIIEQSPQQFGLQAALQEGHRVAQTAGINERGWAVPRTAQDEDEEDDDDDGILYDETPRDLEAGTPRARRTQQMPLGFDRLRVTAGLRRAEISAIRIYFHTQVDQWLTPAIEQEIRRQEPSDALRRRRLQEEQWMEAQGPNSEFRINLNLQATSPAALRMATMRGAVVGTDRDFVWGFFLGFFVGFLMLVWVWMPTVPHKQKLGILTGYCFHLSLGMLRGGASVGEGDYTDDVLILAD